MPPIPDPAGGTRRRNRALAAAGLVVLIGWPLLAPTRRARIHRDVAMVVAAPADLALDAARSLAELRAPQAVAPVIGRLERDPRSLFDPLTGAVVGIDALAASGSRDAVPFLLRVLDGDLAVRWGDERDTIQQELLQIYRRSVLKALGPLGDPRAEPFLIRAVESEVDLFAARYAILSLAQSRSARARSVLTRFAASPRNDADRRLIAIQGLAWCGDDDWNSDGLLDLLEAVEDSWLVDRAVTSIAPSVPPEALPRFRELAAPRPPGMREASLVAAGDAAERRLAIRQGGDVVQRAMLAMSFALPYSEGVPRSRMLARFCVLAPDRAVASSTADAAVARRELRLAALVNEVCTPSPAG